MSTQSAFPVNKWRLTYSFRAEMVEITGAFLAFNLSLAVQATVVLAVTGQCVLTNVHGHLISTVSIGR
jgi:hypothetical protein